MTDFNTVIIKVTAAKDGKRVFRGHLETRKADSTPPRYIALKFFHSWCEEKYPGGQWHYYNAVMGPCHYVTTDGTVIHYRGGICLKADMDSYETELN